jgi:SOS response regulatory protein OraA/RecX
MRAKGFDSETIENTITDGYSDDEERAFAIAEAERHAGEIGGANDYDAVQKAVRRLASRLSYLGFSRPAAYAALEHAKSLAASSDE